MNALFAAVLVTVALALPCLAAEGGASVWPMPSWPECPPAEAGMSAESLARARDYALRRSAAAGRESPSRP